MSRAEQLVTVSTCLSPTDGHCCHCYFQCWFLVTANTIAVIITTILVSVFTVSTIIIMIIGIFVILCGMDANSCLN